VVACGALVAALLACASPALLVRRGALPPFVANIPLWPGATLTLRNGPEGVCHPLARCPRQIGLQPGFSIWLTWQAPASGSRDEIGRRLLFLPSGE
jgi:hypothetical protein